MLGFFSKKAITIFFRDLIIVGMDFAKGEETMPISTIVDKGSLQRGFDPRYFCQINIAF